MTLVPMLFYSLRHAGVFAATLLARRNRNQLFRQMLGRSRRAVPTPRGAAWR
jgi:hypothetical protein